MSDPEIIPEAAMDGASVAPPEPDDRKSPPAGSADAGSDANIVERLEADPSDTDAKLDRGLDESMDASDPPSIAQPRDAGDPVPSSGYDAAEEARRAG